MLIKPKIYDEFKCIASACTDTCCAGWEIYVDEDTEKYYSFLKGQDGKFVREHLNKTEDGTLLCREGERCPFLNENNLCELILRLGEGALCDICSDHPRFFGGTENITAAGVGLCCPEAARLWINSEVSFITEDDGFELTVGESELLADQNSIIDYVLYGDGTLGERLACLVAGNAKDEGLYPRLIKLYASLELLDKGFATRFSGLPDVTADVRFSRLAAYFIFRYYFLLGRELCLKFTAASLIMISAMGGELSVAAKDYSKEIEYDTDNLDKIYDFLDECESLASLCLKVFKC